MNRQSDLQINCAVRRVLVRHWIDLGKSSIRTTSGVCHLAGSFGKLPGITPALTPENVAEIIDEIRRLPSVRRVHATFTNWLESGNAWKPIVSKSPSLSVLGKEFPQTSAVLDLTEAELELNNEPERA